MKAWNVARFFLSLLCLVAAGAACATEDHFLSADQLELGSLLPPPPAEESRQTREELAELLALQAVRTPAMEEAARADAAENVFRFADVLGPQFTASQLPLLDSLFKAVAEDEYQLLAAIKSQWRRPRPFVVEPRLHPCIAEPSSNAYPSRHNSFAMLAAVILSDMVPEKRQALFERAAAYGHNRLVAGVHYRSDTETGRMVGLLIADHLRRDPAFQKAFAEARAELRAVLALPPL